MSDKIYKGGMKELLEAMVDNFLQWDWSDWQFRNAMNDSSPWKDMKIEHLMYIESAMYEFRLKPTTIKINGFEVPKPDTVGGFNQAPYVEIAVKDSNHKIINALNFDHSCLQNARAHFDALVKASKGESED